MELEQLAGLVALTDINGVGDSRAYELFSEFDSIADLRSQPKSAFSEFQYVDSQMHTEIQSLKENQKCHLQNFKTYQNQGISLIGIEDGRYPEALREYHAPLVLYAKGAVERLSDPTVSVSGSRDTNSAGCKWIHELSSELASAGRTIVSGGANGTDTAAHRGALNATAATIVVLGSGVNVPYPSENADLFTEIVNSGGLLISHRPPEAEPNRHSFIERNKTIAALSPAIIIVATDGSGGTQAQYEIARKQGREVFVPPRETDIAPADGIAPIRNESENSSITDSNTLLHELDEAADSLTSKKDTQATDTDSDQTHFDDWS